MAARRFKTVGKNIMNLYEKIVSLEKKISELEKELMHVKGKPVIQGYSNARLDIDQSAKVSDILNRISALESA